MSEETEKPGLDEFIGGIESDLRNLEEELEQDLHTKTPLIGDPVLQEAVEARIRAAILRERLSCKKDLLELAKVLASSES